MLSRDTLTHARTGHFCPGDQDQQNCAAGTFNANTGSTSAAACSACLAGKNTACHISLSFRPLPGSYSAAAASACITSAVGYVTSGSVTACTACAAGKYTDATVGFASCATCAAGAIARPAMPVCLNADGCAGNSCPGATDMSPCPAGSYSPISGLTAPSCLTCSAGKSAWLVCFVIVTGTYSGPGASACSTCSPGSFNAATCTTCSAGSYSNAGVGFTSCSTCQAGSSLRSLNHNCVHVLVQATSATAIKAVSNALLAHSTQTLEQHQLGPACRAGFLEASGVRCFLVAAVFLAITISIQTDNQTPFSTTSTPSQGSM